MSISDKIRILVEELIAENRKTIQIDSLPTYLYHVTTNYHKVMSDGVLMANSGFNSGGLGGSESFGVSFVTDLKHAIAIKDELDILNRVNGGQNPVDVFESIKDEERKIFLNREYERTLSVYQEPVTTALMALRLSRYSQKFSDRPFHGIIIFNEKNIKNKDIGIIRVGKKLIPSYSEIIEGADAELGEIRVLSNVNLKKIKTI